MSSPRITVTAPLANPTAICVRSLVAATAETFRLLANRHRITDNRTYRKLSSTIANGNRTEACRLVRLLDKLIECPDLQHWLANHVLLHNLSINSREGNRVSKLVRRVARLTAIVTSKLVPSTCRMWLILPASCARNRRITFHDLPMMLTYPSSDPRKRLSEPAHTLEISLPSKSCDVSSSGRGIWVTSKKSNDFHCMYGPA